MIQLQYEQCLCHLVVEVQLGAHEDEAEHVDGADQGGEGPGVPGRVGLAREEIWGEGKEERGDGEIMLSNRSGVIARAHGQRVLSRGWWQVRALPRCLPCIVYTT